MATDYDEARPNPQADLTEDGVDHLGVDSARAHPGGVDGDLD